jgi:lipopolysaccharide transport system ATP-binding protein
MDSIFSIQANKVSKAFCTYNHPRERLLASIPWLRRHREPQHFQALDSVSFSLERGKTMGIVGKNGSGKSTLLQIITGTLEPSSGEVVTSGRIGALLELGSGFNPEFSGLENIYFNGLILGLTKQEINQKLDAILGFADIGNFVEQPVKTYSSGMAVRLAFAVQAHCDPDVLVVDEALAVGDELFQKKCHQHLESLKDKGTSILLVTHSCTQINQQCDTAMLLHHGRPLLIDEPHEVTFLYQQLLNQANDDWHAVISHHNSHRSTISVTSRDDDGGHEDSISAEPLVSQSAMSYEAHGAEITGIEVLNAEGEATSLLSQGEPFSLRLTYQATQSFHDGVFTCYITSHTGIHVSGQSLPTDHHSGVPIQAGTTFTVTFSFEGRIWPGLYFVGGGIASPTSSYRFLHRVVDWAVFRVQSRANLRSHGAAQLSSSTPTLRMADTSYQKPESAA